MFRMGLFTLLFACTAITFQSTGEEVFHLKLQTQVKSENEGFYSICTARKSGLRIRLRSSCVMFGIIIIADAVKRLGQFAPRLNEVIARHADVVV